MEVAPFFVDFHHFLSIFIIFYRFYYLRTFVAIYILSRFTHFFRKFFFTKKPSPQHHTFFACMQCACVQYAMCNMQYAMCNMQCACAYVAMRNVPVCDVQYAICNVQYAMCNTQCAIRNVQYAMCLCVQYAICNMQCSMYLCVQCVWAILGFARPSPLQPLSL